MIEALQIEEIRLYIKSLKENELIARKEILLNELANARKYQLTDDEKQFTIEQLTWLDARLEGVPETGVKAWWFRAKRRVKYANDLRKL